MGLGIRGKWCRHAAARRESETKWIDPESNPSHIWVTWPYHAWSPCLKETSQAWPFPVETPFGYPNVKMLKAKCAVPCVIVA